MNWDIYVQSINLNERIKLRAALNRAAFQAPDVEEKVEIAEDNSLLNGQEKYLARNATLILTAAIHRKRTNCTLPDAENRVREYRNFVHRHTIQVPYKE